MLGNDVVDLCDADSRPESFRPRFDARVFAPEERRAIARDENPLARRWAHWAAKEAAFKLAKQIDSGFIFAPARLCVRFASEVQRSGRRAQRTGAVESVDLDGLPRLDGIEVRSFETDEFVHVVALPGGADWGAVDCAAEPIEVTMADPSLAVRRLAIREIARSLGVESSRLSIGRKLGRARASLGERSRIPSVELDGVETSLALSLSHHGRWIAFAMIPRIDELNAGIDRHHFDPGQTGARATTR
jgi:hypothetical protein